MPLSEVGRLELLYCLREELNDSVTHCLGRVETLLEHAAVVGHKGLINDLNKFQMVAKNFAAVLCSPANATAPQSMVDSPPPEAWAEIIANRKARIGQQIPVAKGSILIIDDNKTYSDLLTMLLKQQGHEVLAAETGENGLWLAQTNTVDIILLDIVLPGISGFDVLGQLKGDIALRNIPVILLSGLDQTEHIVKSIEMGAEDYLPKSANPVLLEARIQACLEKKRLRDVEQGYMQQLQAEQQRSERLLLNVLPEPIAYRLKQGETRIVNRFPEATVLFADIVGFTALFSKISPEDVVHYLNEIFSGFDRLAEQHGLEKIKTIGDAYMVVGGLPIPRPGSLEAVAEMALDMQNELIRFNAKNNTSLNIRVGVHIGPVIAGIIGEKKFAYDLWGDAVNTASRMESHGQPGAVHVSDAVYDRLKDKFKFEKRGSIHVKGKGEMTTYLLTGRFVQKYTPQAILGQWTDTSNPSQGSGTTRP